jgi:energy-coupling factor transporter ATP-binding protein EcfA2
MKVHLKSIAVKELHGRPFELELSGLSDGLTVVLGPNGSGKSVLADAASRVFSATDRRHVKRSDRITGSIQIESEQYAVDLRGPGDAVAWPLSSRTELYRLCVTDLILGPKPEDTQRIRDALAGGLNLDRVEIPPPAGYRDRKKSISDAQLKLTKRQTVAAELRNRESSLAAQREALQKARQARADSQRLQSWLDGADHDRTADALEIQIEQIERENPGIKQQAENAPLRIEDNHKSHGNARSALAEAAANLKRFGRNRARKSLLQSDDQRLGRLEAEHTRLTAMQGAAAARRLQAREAVRIAGEQLGLSGTTCRAPIPLKVEDRQRLAELAGKVERGALAVQSCETRSLDARQALDAARQNFRNAGGDPDQMPATLPGPDAIQLALDYDAAISTADSEWTRARHNHQEAVRLRGQSASGFAGIKLPAASVMEQLQKDPKIAVLMDDVRERQAQRKGFEAVAQQLEEDAQKPKAEAEGAQVAAEALRDWLRAVPRTASTNPTRPTIAMVIAMVMAVVAMALGALAGWLVGAIAGALSLLVVAVVLFVQFRSPAVRENNPADVAHRVPRRWLPTEWSAAAVVDQYVSAVRKTEQLSAIESAARAARLGAQGVADDQPQQRLLERINLFEHATGLSPGDPYNLANLVHGLHRLMDADQQLDRAADAERQAETRLGGLTAKQRELLDKLASPCKTGAATKQWRDALHRLLEASKAHRDMTDRHRQANDEHGSAIERLQAFFQTFNWPTSGSLAEARKQFEMWFERTESLVAAESALEEAGNEVARLQRQIHTNGQEFSALFGEYDFPCPGLPADGIQPFRNWFPTSAQLDRSRKSLKDARRALVQALKANGIPDRMPDEDHPARLEQRKDLLHRRKEAADQLRQLAKKRDESRAQARGRRGCENWNDLFDRLGLDQPPAEEQVKARAESLAEAAAGEESLNKEIIETETELRKIESDNGLAAVEQEMAAAVSRLDNWLSEKVDELASRAVIDRISEAVRKEATPAVVARADRLLENLTGGRYTGVDATDGVVTVVDGADESRRKNVNQLSTGSKAHLALAVRMAVIETTETAGFCFPLFLDEVMATSDPDASFAIAQAISNIAACRQAIVFTNQPDDLNVLRQAAAQDVQVIRLGNASLPGYAVPEKMPADAANKPVEGLPITSSIDQWPPVLLNEVVPELNSTARTVHEAKMQIDPQRRLGVECVLCAIEAVRAVVAGAHRRLDSADLDGVDWITDAFRERVAEELRKSAGDPRQFNSLFAALPGMRSANKQGCEQWLADHGYLADPPSFAALTEVARDNLPADWPGRMVVAMGLAGFFAKYASR